APITGGAAGLLVKLDPRPANLQFESRAGFLWVVLAAVVVTLALTQAIRLSRFGAQLVALRENEDAARALGVAPLRVKLQAIALSGAITGAAGCLYVQQFLYLDANIAYGVWISVEALLAAMVGGAGTVFGPLVGAAVLHVLGELAKGFAGRIPGIDLVAYGALLVLVVGFAPRGVLGLLGRLRTLGRAQDAAPAPAREAA
ncbi:MAG: branched-chain amino acid ABC transporter permease, partial [Methylobacteriaceae bacterium]|nr:branched-chain amino acid ABC transporter permease [Methylobacteriaceae bacterium]